MGKGSIILNLTFQSLSFVEKLESAFLLHIPEVLSYREVFSRRTGYRWLSIIARTVCIGTGDTNKLVFARAVVTATYFPSSRLISPVLYCTQFIGA